MTDDLRKTPFDGLAPILLHVDRRMNITDRVVYGWLWFNLDAFDPRPAKLTWLAHKAKVRRNKVSASIWRLVRAGYVVHCGREPGPANKSRNLFRMTLVPVLPEEGTQRVA